MELLQGTAVGDLGSGRVDGLQTGGNLVGKYGLIIAQKFMRRGWVGIMGRFCVRLIIILRKSLLAILRRGLMLYGISP